MLAKPYDKHRNYRRPRLHTRAFKTLETDRGSYPKTRISRSLFEIDTTISHKTDIVNNYFEKMWRDL